MKNNPSLCILRIPILLIILPSLFLHACSSQDPQLVHRKKPYICKEAEVKVGFPFGEMEDQIFKVSRVLNSTAHRTLLTILYLWGNKVFYGDERNPSENYVQNACEWRCFNDDKERMGSGRSLEIGYITDRDSCSNCVGWGGNCGSNCSNLDTQVCICPYGAQPFYCEETKSELKTIAIVSSSTAFGLFVVVMVITYFRSRIRIRFWEKESSNQQDIEAFIKIFGSLAPRRFSYSDIKKMTNSFQDKLGQGGYGCVYKGKLLDGRLVAVKLLSSSKGNGEDFINEVASISKTSHVNVVALLGFCFQHNKRALVYDYGMMILEMAGGRNKSDIEVSDSSEMYFPQYLYNRLEQDENLGMMQGILNRERIEITRKMIIVGLSCIQTDPSKRPSMNKNTDRGNQPGRNVTMISMELAITTGIALWLATAGDGWLCREYNNDDDDCERIKYKSAAKILLVGSGDDEQCTGYGRHSTKCREGSVYAIHMPCFDLPLMFCAMKEVSRMLKLKLFNDERKIFLSIS
ncbi:Serine-threonine/tyrosine-protein kinase, catalytic domain [Dillenia turbinata]|uniref:Serine-threonine/tyrosine-protein kinase, catalytic domain n=1 Tax=Dillenia turbinata TaxID=194707 RepID=A0AAN8V2C0_9MAGN